MKKVTLILLAVVSASVFGKEVDIKKCAAAPVIDGVLDDECWKRAEKMELVSNVMGEDLFETAFAYVTYDDNNIYVACQNNDTMMKEVKAAAKSGADVWADDCVEVFIDPTNEGVGYFHALVNSAGLFDKGYYKKKGSLGTWKTKIVSKAARTEDKWVAELSIPIADMVSTVKKELNKISWNFNIERERPSKSNAPYEDYIWNPTWGSSHMPDRFGTIKFK